MRGVNDDKSVMRRSSVDVSSNKTTSILKERRRRRRENETTVEFFQRDLLRWSVVVKMSNKNAFCLSEKAVQNLGRHREKNNKT